MNLTACQIYALRYPFAARMYADDVQVFPFTVSPVAEPAVRIRFVERTVVGERYLKYKMSGLAVEYNAAYPLYWPVYIVSFKTRYGYVVDGPTTMVPVRMEDDTLYPALRLSMGCAELSGLPGDYTMFSIPNILGTATLVPKKSLNGNFKDIISGLSSNLVVWMETASIGAIHAS